MRLLYSVLLLTSVSFSFVGCETTGGSGYGYMATGFNEQSVVELFAVSDAAINEQDYVTYSSLFGPGFSVTDSSAKYGMSDAVMTKSEYLELVKDILKYAKRISLYTSIMTMEFDEERQIANVKVREEQDMYYQGRDSSYVSLVEVEVGYEDGWMFFKKMEKTAMQEIKG